MEKVPLTTYLKKRGAAAELARRLKLSANAISVMHRAGRNVLVYFHPDGRLELREDKQVAIEVLDDSDEKATA